FTPEKFFCSTISISEKNRMDNLLKDHRCPILRPPIHPWVFNPSFADEGWESRMFNQPLFLSETAAS
ncbi:MAG: hypothetical protein FWD64_11485, partial [Acidobacteriaceae bacterium]|nr:hypothetical protein [Acidobacteriaceae bacterium]